MDTILNLNLGGESEAITLPDTATAVSVTANPAEWTSMRGSVSLSLDWSPDGMTWMRLANKQFAYPEALGIDASGEFLKGRKVRLLGYATSPLLLACAVTAS